MSFFLQVPRTLYDGMIQHAVAVHPHECCGLLAGRQSDDNAGNPIAKAIKRYPLQNALASPVEYESDARSMFDAIRDIEGRGLVILAVYHSHPSSPAVPSKKDRERNYSPDIVNFIISLDSAEPTVRAWWLTETSQVEASWECVPNEP